MPILDVLFSIQELGLVFVLASHWRIYIDCGGGSFFFTIYIGIFASLVSISRYHWYPWAVVCIFLHYISTCIPRFDSSLLESKHSSYMQSLMEYEGRCLASLARAWQHLQDVRRWIHLKNRLSCYAVCGPCGSTVSCTLVTLPQPMLSCTFPASG